MNTLAQRIDRILPQTQCRECGYSGCMPYAEALAAGSAAGNLCAPGGHAVAVDIAGLLERSVLEPAKTQQTALAWIDETVCIGCTACIRACPVDAIFGATKQMHTVIAEECTGCGLCIAPCPVDCIHMQPVTNEFLPQAHYLSDNRSNERFAAAGHARVRYQRRTQRLEQAEAAKQAQFKARAADIERKAEPAATAATLNPAALIAQAMSRAQAMHTQRTVPANREDYREQQVKAAQAKAAYRRAQRDLKYGNEAEQAAALEFLRAYKAAQEEQNGSED